VAARVAANVTRFRANYLLFGVVAASLAAALSPLPFLGAGLCAALYLGAYGVAAGAAGPLRVCGVVVLDGAAKALVVGLAVLGVAAATGAGAAAVALATVVGGVVGLHAALWGADADVKKGGADYEPCAV